MTLWESVRVALRALSANRLRAALTMLGVIIGVAAVIALVAVGQGAQQQITERIQQLGTNLLFVRPGAVREGVVRLGEGVPTLTYEDALALAELPSVALVAPESMTFAQVVAGGANTNTRVVGTTPEYPAVRNLDVAFGEFFSAQHVDGRVPVVVLGAAVADTLFGGVDPLGQMVRISTGSTALNARVIGVMESQGGSGFGNQDEVVFLPLTTMQTRLARQRTTRGEINVSLINVQVVDRERMAQAMEEVAEVLRRRHRVVEDDFTIQSQEQFLEAATQVTGIMTMLLGSIAGISLVVGGIGIMNIMLVSVTERTREIGIRKAVGARRRDILLQFLVEAVLVSVVGGVLGIAAGAGISRALASVSLGGQNIATAVAPGSILLAFGVSAAVGVFFGIYPALRAARLHPIEALRYE